MKNLLKKAPKGEFPKVAGVKVIAAALILMLLAGCSAAAPSLSPVSDSPRAVCYENTQYGFSLTLPAEWENYRIINERWEGNDIKTGRFTTIGPQLSIRHPRWTSESPRQDIPIMIFTLEQWNSLQQEKYHIGPAPIGPSELGRNSSYVFALPARYNYAVLPGVREVESILAGHPLQITQPEQAIQEVDPSTLLLLNIAWFAFGGELADNNLFPVKTSRIADVEKAWGKPDSTEYRGEAGGTYATYKSRHIVFAFNKQGQIIEVSSFDSRLQSISLGKVREILATPPMDALPAYAEVLDGKTILGYTAGPEFKLEFVFSLSPDGADQTLDHYNILYTP